MSALRLTRHAVTRMAQRGLSCDDLELVRCIGTEVEGGYLVRQKDFQLLECELKRLREQARRMVGKRVVVVGGRIVTAYHTDGEKARRLLRTS